MKNGIPVIHFLDFEDFLTELEWTMVGHDMAVVRVQSHSTRQRRSMGQHNVPLVELCAVVSVGIAFGGQILSYCPYKESVSYVMEATPVERREWQEKQAAADRLAERIVRLLQGRFLVRRGLIDLGDAQVVCGNPPKLEESTREMEGA